MDRRCRGGEKRRQVRQGGLRPQWMGRSSAAKPAFRNQGAAAMKKLFAVLCVLFAGVSLAAEVPKFQVDPTWPKPLPNNWIIGQPAGIAVDAADHVWVVHRPASLTDDERAASFSPPRTKCCVPAPQVLEFDQAGNVLRSWGGKGEGYDWPGNEPGIYVDQKDFAWLAGNRRK